MKAVLLFLLIVIFTEKPVHPLHLSVTEIAFDEKEKELEIMVRIFSDDLESAIQKELDKPELSLAALDKISRDQKIWNYVQPKFAIMLEGKKQLVKYLGHEVDTEATTLYIQVQPVKKWKSIEITNTIITELFEDQSNLVNITLNNETKSLRLMRDTPSGKLAFEIK